MGMKMYKYASKYWFQELVEKTKKQKRPVHDRLAISAPKKIHSYPLYPSVFDV
jgi:hypothetical protein